MHKTIVYFFIVTFFSALDVVRNDGANAAIISAPDLQVCNDSTLVSQIPVDDIQAARFLQQATFGPSIRTIEEVKSIGYEEWINRQIALPVTFHLPILVHKRNGEFKLD